MEEVADPHFKRERPASYGQHPPMHMPPAEAAHLHNYHQPSPQGAQMPHAWNPAPSPYHDGHDHRPPPTEPPSSHAPPSAYVPPQSYPPAPPPLSQTPTYPPDPGYSRHNSTPGPTRSPPSAHPSQYPGPLNGAPPQESYYPPSDYRSRPPYGPSGSPANSHQQPGLHLQTSNHDMMSAQPPQQPPPSGYGLSTHPGGPPPTPGYWPAPDAWYQQQRRKPVRAAQACDSCRQRKAKCDEGRPDCTHCKENNLRCTYRDVPPQKSEKQMLQMGEKVDALSDKLDGLDDRMKANEDKLNSVLEAIRALANASASEPRSTTSVPMTKTRSRLQTKEESLVHATNHYFGHQSINAPFMDSFEKDQLLAPVDSSDPGAKGRGPMGASDLLLWPGIKEIVPQDIQVSYVMDGEAQRGLLRLYGCGEGEDKGDGHDGAPSPAASHSSGRNDEDASTSSPSGVWGTGQLPQREASQSRIYDHPGGVTPNGELLLDCTAVDTYVQSYLERMHILHPFLDPRVLRKMVASFKVKHSWDYSSVHPRIAHSVGAGSKRKRESSASPSSAAEDLSSIPHHNGGRLPVRSSVSIEHSVSNAIILLVIALGKICMHDQPLPGPPRSSSVTSNARLNQQPQPLLGYGDLPSYPPPPSSAPASPYTAAYINGNSSGPPVSTLHGKNMDVIPGLAYYAKAADILGELPGGVDVSHIQANLLAGLYMGQLARIVPSHHYIATACKACQILIRSADYKDRKIAADRRNLINFAFWSCLQLESDILAEMDIPSSGIIQKEASMLLEIPTALTIADPEKEKEDPARNNPQEFLRHYSNQIQLRRTINDAVHNIYNNERDQNKPSKLIETIGENLENWRHLLKDWDWQDAKHESTDINHARMRGKYYGAKYIINRPALHYALSLSFPPTPMSRPSDSPLGSGSQSEHTSPAIMHHANPIPHRRVNDMRPPARASEQLEDWILEACRRCIEAAIKSTTAFDKVAKRLIITNILGTAHAQFGNVLVLAATFNSANPQLRCLVPEETLRHLLYRTIEFLEDKAPISPALETDAKILKHVQSKLFPSVTSLGPYPNSVNTSFSSNR